MAEDHSFSKLGKGRPAKDALCLVCGKTNSQHTPVTRKSKAGAVVPTRTPAGPTGTSAATVVETTTETSVTEKSEAVESFPGAVSVADVSEVASGFKDKSKSTDW